MGHLQIAYHLVVIAIGFAALAIAGFWALKSREAYLRDFCLVYALFTTILILTVLHQYLVLNVKDYSLLALYWIMGIKQVLNFAVIVAAVNLLLRIYIIAARKKIVLLFLLLMVIACFFMFMPFGTRLDTAHQDLQLGIGYQIASTIYFLSFTAMLSIGYAFLRRVLKTKLSAFTIGLLIFASVGYLETAFCQMDVIHLAPVVLTDSDFFLFSSIPYALYGIFVVYYFLNMPVPTFIDLAQIPENFFSHYAITGREREIIQCVVSGKSNAEIAEELVISLATVKTHLHNIYTKFDIDSRFELIAKIRSAE